MEYRLVQGKDCPAESFIGDENYAMAAIDKNGDIVAAAGLMVTITIDPLWIRPDKRRSMFLLRRLWEHLRKYLISRGAKSVGGVTLREGQENADLVKRIAMRLTGAKIIKTDILHIDLE